MPALDESQMMHLLIAGVTPALQEKLLEQQVIPYTRAELLPLLSRLDAGLKRTHATLAVRRQVRRDHDVVEAAPP